MEIHLAFVRVVNENAELEMKQESRGREGIEREIFEALLFSLQHRRNQAMPEAAEEDTAIAVLMMSLILLLPSITISLVLNNLQPCSMRLINV